MARLPSFIDLSGPESLRSGRVIAEYDTSAVGRGLANLGQGIENAGASLKAKADEEKRKDTALDLTRADAYAREGFLAVDNEFANDPDYSTYSQRAAPKTGEVVKKAGDLIRDPRAKELWLAGAQGDAAQYNDKITDRGVAVKRAADVVAFDDALEVNRRIYVDPDTPDDAKAKAKQAIEASIKVGQETGLLDPVEAEARRKTFIDDAEFSRGKLAVERDPSIITRNPVKAVVDRIIGVESGGRANAKNPRSSASGLGQFTDSTWVATVRKHRPDLAGMRTDEILELKNSPTLGREMTTRHTEDNTRALSSAGYETTPGNIYLAHFAGLGGAKEILSADPGASVESVLGSAVVKANPFLAGKTAGWVRNWTAEKMGGKSNPDWYKNISPEQRQAIDQLAETRSNQISVERRAIVETATTNAPTAIMNTGTYSGSLPTPEQFVQAYGPYEGPDRYDNFVAAMNASEKAYSMQTMSSGDIQKMVDEAKPTSSGDDAALQQTSYNAISSAADATLKAREADPAKYVRQAFPAVDAAWDNVAGPQSNAQSYQEAIAISVAAQEQLGVTDIKPLPKEAAQFAVDKFKDENLPETERIAAVSTAMMATPDAEQRRAIFEQMVDAGLPDTTEGAFVALSRGDTGAARRLFQASVIDPEKLPGKTEYKPAQINEAVQSILMDDDQVGDIYYGLSDGTTENAVRAQRDGKLITNAVNIRLRNGEDLEAAIAGVSKDLFGDVQVVLGDGSVNVQALIPSTEDPSLVVDGLRMVMPDVRAALEKELAIPGEAPSTADGTAAVLKAATSGYADNVLAEGYFRNSGDTTGEGYVFMDPYTGEPVADANGKPIIFRPKPPAAGDPVKTKSTEPLTDDAFDAFQKKFGSE